MASYHCCQAGNSRTHCQIGHTVDNLSLKEAAVRRLLFITGLIAALLIAVPASASVPQYIYKACNDYGQAHVCLKLNTVQQSDGQGWNVVDVRIYGYTDNNPNSCANGFDGGGAGDPSIFNYATDVWKVDTNGNRIGNPMHRTSPDLDDADNGCFWKYLPGITFNSSGVDASFNYKARLNLQPDPTATLTIHVKDSGAYSCNPAADQCSRSAP